ncbi:pentatricopeptide repeat-containing protein, partial [Tanacetum coccineum]
MQAGQLHRASNDKGPPNLYMSIKKDKADVVRTEPIFKDNKRHMYWRLKGCSDNPGILLQDIGIEYAHGFRHDEKTYGVIVMKLLYANEFRRAEDIVERMRKDECKVTDDIFLVMCRAYGLFSILVNENQLKVALKFYRYMRQLGFPPNVPSLNVLIKALSKNSGTIDSAIQIFHEMPNHGCIPDTYTYGTLINGLCRIRKISEAKELLKEMKTKGCSPSVVTYTSLIHRLFQLTNLDKAKALLQEMEAKSIIANVYTYSSLMDG